MLKFYSFDFEFLHAEPKYISTKWSLLYNGVGTFEAHFPFWSDVVKLICENRYLVVKEGENTAVIIGYGTQDDFAVYGRTCSFLLGKRVTKAFGTLTGTADSLARNFVREAFADVKNFTLGEELDISETVEFAKDRNLLTVDAVTQCLNMQNLGHELSFNTAEGCWVYRNLMGKELDLIFSEANKNAFDTQITCDLLDLADCGWYEKQTEADGAKATETAYACTEDTKSGIYRWEAILGGSSETEALGNLSQKKLKDETSLKTRSVTFGRDYNLGDVVRVQIVKGALKKTVKKRIKGVEIVRQSGSYGEQPIFEEV